MTINMDPEPNTPVAALNSGKKRKKPQSLNISWDAKREY
jgi:hypothetical protein